MPRVVSPRLPDSSNRDERVVLHDAFRMFDRNHQNLYHTLNQDRTAPAMDESRWTFPTNPRMNSPNS
jgi:hypothetical protein